MVDWITTTEARRLTGYHIVYLREIIRDGKIKAQKFGRTWQVDRKSLLVYLKTSKQISDRRHGPRRR
ncbi:MAG: helix-turn-helix domain-containing protein [Anaerolineae bacterium]|nr:helix-turn-helix domain-containing protein [Anaerolineae bacterium]